MSAKVTIPDPENFANRSDTVVVEVAKANGYEIDDDTGWLHLKTSAWAGDKVACFKEWHHVVIESNRGPDGRFTKRGES